MVRGVRRDDENLLRRIRTAAWDPQGSPVPQPPEDRPFLEAIDQDERVLVAVIDGTVVGYAQFEPATRLRSSRHVKRLSGIDVDPEHRREGVASALLEAVIRKVEYDGARRLTLRVFSTNTGALALYESFGFEREGVLREEFEIDGAYVDDVLMALSLPRPRRGSADWDED